MLHDLIVIGAGPGGYVAAIRAAQLGLSVACIERQFLGGTCLNVGCIPSKALLDSTWRYEEARHGLARHGIRVGEVKADVAAMMARKQEVVKALTGGVGYLFRKHKVTHLAGQARLLAADRVEVRTPEGTVSTCQARNVLIATGSAPVELPGLPVDETHILSSTGALALKEAPRRLLVVGGGYIGLELGSVWSRLGSEVLVVEFLERILPGSDREMTAHLQRVLEKQGLRFRFQTAATKAEVDGGVVRVQCDSGPTTTTEEADKMLVAVGRRPVTDGLNLEAVGVRTDPRGFIRVDHHFATDVRGVWAIGDVIGGLLLAHKAQEEGIAVAQIIAGQSGHVNYRACPAVVFTHPELAQVGLTEEEANAATGGKIKVGRFPFTANGRARGLGDTEGLVKVIGSAATDRLLGVHVLGPHASDMIAEAAVAMEFAASVEDLGRAFHAHPTLPEAMKEAALAADRRAIHI